MTQEDKLFLASPAVKHYYINRILLQLDNDRVLWKETEEGGEKRKVLVVPIELRREVLRLCYDIPAAGHQGIEHTKAQMRLHLYWYGMMWGADRFVSTCGPCSRKKRPQCHASAEMIKYHAGAPMERVHLDFLGPRLALRLQRGMSMS